jgi:hypothetical protein
MAENEVSMKDGSRNGEARILPCRAADSDTIIGRCSSVRLPPTSAKPTESKLPLLRLTPDPATLLLARRRDVWAICQSWLCAPRRNYASFVQ